MNKKNYDEMSVVRILSKNPNVQVDSTSRIVVVNRNSNTVGNGTWGKIDYLVNYCDYTQMWNSGNNIANHKKADTETTDPVKEVIPKIKKVFGSKKKLDMAAMVKDVMKKVTKP
jgi:hypothetical protein